MFSHDGVIIQWLRINPSGKYAYGEEYTLDAKYTRYRSYRGDYSISTDSFDIYKDMFCDKVIQDGEGSITLVCFEDANSNLCTPNGVLINDNGRKKRKHSVNPIRQAVNPIRRYTWRYKGYVEKGNAQGEGTWTSTRECDK